jgi:hypothetical protein
MKEGSLFCFVVMRVHGTKMLQIVVLGGFGKLSTRMSDAWGLVP